MGAVTNKRLPTALLCAVLIAPAFAQELAEGAPDAAAEEPLAVIPVPQAAEAAPEPLPADARPTYIEEIVVTAQKREQRVNEVPITISAFSGEQLQALGVTDVRDIGVLVPGLTVNDSGQGTPIYTLRGVGFNDTTYTATGTVGLYVDEVNLPYSAMSKGPSLDIERVEVLKGPQGTLYGRNTTGGLINQITRKPTAHFESGGSLSYGSYESFDGEAFVSGPLADSLSGRIALRGLYSGEGWQTSNTRPDDTLGEVAKGSGRVSFDWRPADDVSVYFAADGWIDRSEPQAPQVVGINPQNGIFGEAALSPQVKNYPLVPLRGADPRVADWNPEREWQRNDRFASQALRVDWDLGERTRWTTLLSHLKVEARDSDDIQSGFNFYNIESTTNARIETSALESRLSGAWGEHVDWLIGVNLSRDDGREKHYLYLDSVSGFFPIKLPLLDRLADLGLDLGGIVASIPGLPGQYAGILQQLQEGNSPLSNRFLTMGESHIRQRAAFTSIDWRFVDTLTLNVGARYTENRENFEGCSAESADSVGLGFNNVFTLLSYVNALQYRLRTGQAGNPGIVGKEDCLSLGADGNTDPYIDTVKDRNWSGRVALDWQPDAQSLYYVSFSRGYKAGGFPVLNASNKEQLTPTRQEELLATEFGAKLTLWERRLQANVAAFYYDYKDKQLLTKLRDPIFGPLPVLRNAPRSHVFGAEVELQARPVNGLFLSLAATRIHTQVDEFISTNDSGDEQDFSGRPFNYSPEYEINAVADYTVPLFGLYAGIGADVQRSGQTNGTLSGREEYDMPAYTLLGARLHLSAPDQRWSLAVFGRNLTDELYSIASYNAGDSIARFTGRPRTYGVTVGFLLQ